MPRNWTELRERVRAVEHAEQEIRFLEGELERLRKVQDAREREYAAEARDVERAERFTIAGWIARLVGTHEEELARERHEEVVAGLRLARIDGEIEELEARLAGLQAGQAAREEDRRAFAEASERRRAAAVARGGSTARRIEDLEARIEARARTREALQRAGTRCQEASAALERARAALDEAFGHGVSDLFATGYHAWRSAEEGKAAHLRAAQADARLAAERLGGIARELEGGGLEWRASIGVPEVLMVTDRWIDGWITDWITLRKISASRERLAPVLAASRALGERLLLRARGLDTEDARDRRLLDDLLGA